MTGAPPDPPRRGPAPERLRAAPVYLVTLAMVPLTMIASAWVFAVVAAAIVLGRGELGPDFGARFERVLTEELATGAPLLALGVAANAIVFTAVPLLVARRGAHRDRARARLGLLPSSVVDHGLATVGLLGLTAALDALLHLTGLHDYGRLAEMREAITSIPLDDRLPLAFVVGAGAGVPEELFFRGYVLRRLAVVHRPVLALAASSLLFGLFHLDYVHAPVAAAMGVLLGVVVLRTGSVYPAITAHTVNNAVAVLNAGVEAPDWMTWPMFVGGAAASAVALFGIVRRHGGEARRIVW